MRTTNTKDCSAEQHANSVAINSHQIRLDKLSGYLFEHENQADKMPYKDHTAAVNFLAGLLLEMQPNVDDGIPRWAETTPDYGYLAEAKPSDEDYEQRLYDRVRLGAMELALRIILDNSAHICWADRRGLEWRDDLIARLLLELR